MKITVALPVYNGAEFLPQALDSILCQTGVDFELLISEGGSKDATARIIKDYAARDGRIRYAQTPGRLAQVPNCNRAVEMAKTEWIQFMCHDDILLPGALARIVETIAAAPKSVALIGHSPALLFRNHLCYDASVNRTKLFEWMPSVNPFPLANPRRPAVLHQGRLISEQTLRLQGGPCLPALTTGAVRRDVLLAQGGFDPAYAQFDTMAWSQMLLRHDYLFIPEPLSLTRIHGAQVTAQLTKSIKTIEDCRKYWPGYLQTARTLGLPVTLRSRFIPLVKSASQAASYLYVLARKKQWKSWRELFFGLPWPVNVAALPLLLRNSYHEKRRTAPLAGCLNVEDYYP